MGLPVQTVPPAPRPEGPGARTGLRHHLLQAQHGSGPGQVSLYSYQSGPLSLAEIRRDTVLSLVEIIVLLTPALLCHKDTD